MTTPATESDHHERLEVRYTLTSQDYWDFNAFWMGRSLLRYYVLFFFVILWAPTFFAMQRSLEPLVTLWGGSLTTFPAFLFFLALSYAWVRWRNRRITARTPSMFNEQIVMVDDESIQTKISYFESYMTWEGVIEAKEMNKHIFLLCGPGLATIIPKRAFATVEQATQFLRLATQPWMKDKPRA